MATQMIHCPICNDRRAVGKLKVGEIRLRGLARCHICKKFCAPYPSSSGTPPEVD